MAGTFSIFQSILFYFCCQGIRCCRERLFIRLKNNIIKFYYFVSCSLAIVYHKLLNTCSRLFKILQFLQIFSTFLANKNTAQISKFLVISFNLYHYEDLANIMSGLRAKNIARTGKNKGFRKIKGRGKIRIFGKNIDPCYCSLVRSSWYMIQY